MWSPRKRAASGGASSSRTTLADRCDYSTWSSPMRRPSCPFAPSTAFKTEPSYKMATTPILSSPLIRLEGRDMAASCRVAEPSNSPTASSASMRASSRPSCPLRDHKESGIGPLRLEIRHRGIPRSPNTSGHWRPRPVAVPQAIRSSVRGEFAAAVPGVSAPIIAPTSSLLVRLAVGRSQSGRPASIRPTSHSLSCRWCAADTLTFTRERRLPRTEEPTASPEPGRFQSLRNFQLVAAYSRDRSPACLQTNGFWVPEQALKGSLTSGRERPRGDLPRVWSACPRAFPA